jgi:hypothetical protein
MARSSEVDPLACWSHELHASYDWPPLLFDIGNDFTITETTILAKPVQDGIWIIKLMSGEKQPRQAKRRVTPVGLKVGRQVIE